MMARTPAFLKAARKISRFFLVSAEKSFTAERRPSRATPGSGCSALTSSLDPLAVKP